MRILVYPNNIGTIGGSQINAIDLAATMADAGHDVLVYGVDGILTPYITEKGLPFLPARELRYRPAISRIAQLLKVTRQKKIDIIHAYEWPACLDAYFGAHLLGRVPLLCTVLSMDVPPLVPKSVPLVLGTEQLGDRARRSRDHVSVVEPPIDVEGDHPGIDGSEFRSAHQVAEDEILIVTVSRLSIELKLDALMNAIDAADLLAKSHKVRLLIVGDGEARDQLDERATRVNEHHGREVVTLAGPTMNPGPAYAAADVVVGMGSSALRALSIGKPVVVQGEEGFSLPFRPEDLDTFLWQGFWGIGNGDDGAQRLADHLLPLVIDSELRSSLGVYGRDVVVERFSISRAATRIEELYTQTIRESKGLGWRVGEASTTAVRALRVEYDSHLPSVKRARASEKAARLGMASQPSTPR